MNAKSVAACALMSSVLVPSGEALTIVINPGAELAANGPALAAFSRAAAQWESLFTDAITVDIDANVRSFGMGMSGTIGQASSALVAADFSVIRNQMVVDAAGEADDGVVASLPTLAEFSATLLPGTMLAASGGMIQLGATKANAKALGFGVPVGPDGTIEFNSDFTFDFDNSDGVIGTDFETVAAHEIGHVLGFSSVVDAFDEGLASGLLLAGDLFRFAQVGAANPSDNVEFTNTPRELRPGVATVFDDLDSEILHSTGVAMGDGRQASHWKDNLGIGVMDPTLAAGEVVPISPADIRFFDLIGYDFVAVAVPEPGRALLGLAGVLGLALSHRRRVAASAS